MSTSEKKQTERVVTVAGNTRERGAAQAQVENVSIFSEGSSLDGASHAARLLKNLLQSGGLD